MVLINRPEAATLVGRVLNPDSSPLYGATVRFTLDKSGTNGSTVFLGNQGQVVEVSSDGYFNISLWTNQESESPTPYRVDTIVGRTVVDSFLLYLSANESYISLQEARRLSKIYEDSLTEG